MTIRLDELAEDVAHAIKEVDTKGIPFRSYAAGVGPYGEPQLVKLIASYLNRLPEYGSQVQTRRNPDLLVKGEWAVEFKITRPFGDNGREAENWSVNLLHPYPGKVSAIGDCIKLQQRIGPERKAVMVIGYEHSPSKIDLERLISAFEIVANHCGVTLSPRIERTQSDLVHPIHQRARLFAWEVL